MCGGGEGQRGREKRPGNYKYKNYFRVFFLNRSGEMGCDVERGFVAFKI